MKIDQNKLEMTKMAKDYSSLLIFKITLHFVAKNFFKSSSIYVIDAKLLPFCKLNTFQRIQK